ncbi:MAG: UDP-glucose/GDP-mannose dehydrogenase family protein [Balneolales bacterium]
MMNISVIGSGYVGLVSGVCLAEKGHKVTCVDVDREKVNKINQGITPIYERGLSELLRRNLHGTFFASCDLQEAVMQSQLSLIAVGTPYIGEEIDLTSIKQVARDIGHALRGKDDFHAVVIKSTVVPGTTNDVVLPILEETSGKKAGVDFGVGMNPEFLREGAAISDFMGPDRIVLGATDNKTLHVMEEVYRVFDNVDVVKTNTKTAEMIKYTANSLLATLISFSNEIGNLCSRLGDIDVVDVMSGVHKDKRFSPLLADGERVTPGFVSYLAAGCGFGGSCFPKDVKALIAHGKKAGNSMALLDSVIHINEKQPREIITLLEKNFNGMKGVRVAILGMAFKPETDDMRESPAIPIIRHLLTEGAEIQAYDPVAEVEAEKLFGNHQIHYYQDVSQAISGVDAVVLLTSWEEFAQVPGMMKATNPQPLFIDGRRMLTKTSFTRYEGIGLSI